MRIYVVWSTLRYIATSKINNKPLTDIKDDFSIIVEKMENGIGRTVHRPYSLLVYNENHKQTIQYTKNINGTASLVEAVRVRVSFVNFIFDLERT